MALSAIVGSFLLVNRLHLLSRSTSGGAGFFVLSEGTADDTSVDAEAHRRLGLQPEPPGSSERPPRFPGDPEALGLHGERNRQRFVPPIGGPAGESGTRRDGPAGAPGGVPTIVRKALAQIEQHLRSSSVSASLYRPVARATRQWLAQPVPPASNPHARGAFVAVGRRLLGEWSRLLERFNTLRKTQPAGEVVPVITAAITQRLSAEPPVTPSQTEATTHSALATNGLAEQAARQAWDAVEGRIETLRVRISAALSARGAPLAVGIYRDNQLTGAPSARASIVEGIPGVQVGFGLQAIPADFLAALQTWANDSAPHRYSQYQAIIKEALTEVARETGITLAPDRKTYERPAIIHTEEIDGSSTEGPGKSGDLKRPSGAGSRSALTGQGELGESRSSDAVRRTEAAISRLTEAAIAEIADPILQAQRRIEVERLLIQLYTGKITLTQASDELKRRNISDERRTTVFRGVAELRAAQLAEAMGGRVQTAAISGWELAYRLPPTLFPDEQSQQLRVISTRDASPRSLIGVGFDGTPVIGVTGALGADGYLLQGDAEALRQAVLYVDARLVRNGRVVSELDAIPNEVMRAWVGGIAGLTGAAAVDVVDATDFAYLVEEAVKAGELIRLPDGNYFARSHPKDTARAAARTFVATDNPKDKGLFNNWRDEQEMRDTLNQHVTGAMARKRMFVVPYLMGPPKSEFGQVGVELTDSPYVALNMLLMTKAGKVAWEELERKGKFIKGVHVTGDLDALWAKVAQAGPSADARHFVAFPRQGEIWSFGSAYGGNALLGKKFHALRIAMFKALEEGWLAEHMLILELEDKQTGEKKYACAAFPSASGKTNLAMLVPPEAFGNRYVVRVVGDDIAWLRIGQDGRLRAVNPENGFFGVVPGTNEQTNPMAMRSIGPGKGVIFTNVAYNEQTQELWWEGKTKDYPADLSGWLDWEGKSIAGRAPENQRNAKQPWAHPNSRFTTSIRNAPNLSPAYDDPAGVPISAFFFGGRVSKGEPLIRQLPDLLSGIYDAAMMGAEQTAAAEGQTGQFKPDPFALRDFYAYPEVGHAQHWINVMDRIAPELRPAFFHVNWFRKGPHGEWLWPGYGENLRPLLWALARAEGKADGIVTPIGIIPRQADLNLDGLNMSEATWNELMRFDAAYWTGEAARREAFLKELKETVGHELPPRLRPKHGQFVEGIRQAAAPAPAPQGAPPSGSEGVLSEPARLAKPREAGGGVEPVRLRSGFDTERAQRVEGVEPVRLRSGFDTERAQR
ncbi:MAG: phosphoenolpyruvate carboxykinase (GTP), partial [Candidatus Omnitrophica bacterium]|nr:phosphoenolpyruvate carboxykinase (GTP) [Candidatus Omnitrophota bacterium]